MQEQVEFFGAWWRVTIPLFLLIGLWGVASAVDRLTREVRRLREALERRPH